MCVSSRQTHLSVQKHGQGLAGAQPIPIAEIIFGIPSQGPILASFQHQGVKESQGEQQSGPCLGLLGAALGKHCGRQGAVAVQQGSFDALQHTTHWSHGQAAGTSNRPSRPGRY